MGDVAVIVMLGWVAFLLTRIIVHLEKIQEKIERAPAGGPSPETGVP